MPGAGQDASPRQRSRPRLVLAVTHPMTARYLLRGQADCLRREGFEVWILSGPGHDIEAFKDEDPTPVVTLPLRREISPVADLAALFAFVRVLRRLRPDLINAGTPKAGMLGMLAAWIARVPLRVYTLRGLRLETTTGIRRALLRWANKTAASLAHRVVCVSPSLRRRVVELGIARPDKAIVLGHGSSNGVDLERFAPRSECPERAAALRAELGIAPRAPVIGFVGRFTRDKGIADLAAAFLDSIAGRFPECRLLLLGDYEAGDPLPPAVHRRLEADPRVIAPGFVTDSAPYYAVMDVLAFPSYREGLPNAPLEAAACEVPTAGYAAVGTIDAVDDGVTGKLVPVGDVAALTEALAGYLADEERRRRHGAAARARAAARFDRELVWTGWTAEYRRLLAGGANG